jgi:hypothetical protein
VPTSTTDINFARIEIAWSPFGQPMTRVEVSRRLDEMEIALHRGKLKTLCTSPLFFGAWPLFCYKTLRPRGRSVPMMLGASAKAKSMPLNEQRRLSEGSGCDPFVAECHGTDPSVPDGASCYWSSVCCSLDLARRPGVWGSSLRLRPRRIWSKPLAALLALLTVPASRRRA